MRSESPYGISHDSGNSSSYNVDNSFIKLPFNRWNVAMVTDYAIRITIKGSSMACLSCNIDQ